MSLSIIIPTLGERDSMLHAIWSVQNQTVPTECILLLDKDHKGAGPTRNLGVKQAKTTWVGFCDDDDWLDPQYHFWLKKYRQYDMVVFQMQRTDGMILPDHTDADRLNYNWVGISFAMRTSIAKRFPFRNILAEDYDVIQRVVRAGLRVVVAPEVAYFVG